MCASERVFERWVLRPRPRPAARTRLFCLPYAGAGASIFFDWACRLPESIELCAIQLPGRENRLGELAYTDSVTLVRDLWHALQSSLDRPYAVFGHSMGALVGFELVAQCAREGVGTTRRLFVGASRPPHLPNRRPPMRAASDETLLAEISRLGGTPSAVLESRELMQLALPTLRADFAVHETERSDAVLDVPVTAFCGCRDPEVSADEMSQWAARTRGDFRLRLLEGDHFCLRSDRDTLLAWLVTDLEEATANT